MRIEIKSVYIYNFRSIEDLEFNFESVGLHVIRGANGSGKTSIIESVVWALTGKDLKGGAADDVIREGSRSCSVNVYGYVNGKQFAVSRSRGTANKLVVVVDDEAVDGLHMKDVQDALYRHFNLTETTLLNTLIFGQRMTRLVELPNTDKRKLFDEMFDLSWVDVAKENARDNLTILTQRIDDTEEEIKENEFLIRSNKQRIQSISKMIETAMENHKHLKIAQNLRINDLRVEIKNLKRPVKIPEITIEKIDIEGLQSEVNKLEEDRHNAQLELHKVSRDLDRETRKFEIVVEDLTDLKTRMIKTHNKLDRLKNDPGSFKCEACGQPLGAEEIKELIEITTEGLADDEVCVDEKKKIKLAINSDVEFLDEQVKKARKNYESIDAMYKAKKAEISPALLNNQEYIRQFNKREDMIRIKKSLDSQLKEVNKKLDRELLILRELEEKPAVDDDLFAEGTKLETQIEDAEQKIGVLDKDLKLYLAEAEAYKFWSKTGFGSNGIKSFVFKAMLQQLNETVAKYGNRLGISIDFTVNIEGTRKTFDTLCRFSDSLIVRKYESLSGGEKSRVDIALAFGLFDLLKSTSVAFNVLFLDEVFENLDEAGIDEAFELLRDIAKSTGVYLISHREIDSLNTKYFTVVKNGTTTIS